MSLPFSDSTGLTGIVEQTRVFVRLDSNQLPTVNIVNSCNNWKNMLVGYALEADARFKWDATNQTDLPTGLVDLVEGQSDYSFLQDEDGNDIITLTKVSMLIGGYYQPLKPVDMNDLGIDLAYFATQTAIPRQYMKVADNIIRLNSLPSAANQTLAAGLKFDFQRTAPYFSATDTTAKTGFSPLLDRGFIIASAYDAALTLGLAQLGVLATEMQREQLKLVNYFKDRTEDEKLMSFKSEHTDKTFFV